MIIIICLNRRGYKLHCLDFVTNKKSVLKKYCYSPIRVICSVNFNGMVGLHAAVSHHATDLGSASMLTERLCRDKPEQILAPSFMLTLRRPPRTPRPIISRMHFCRFVNALLCKRVSSTHIGWGGWGGGQY